MIAIIKMKELNFIPGIRKIHKQLKSKECSRISEIAVELINDMIIDVANRIVILSVNIAKYSNTKTVTWKDIHFGTKIVLHNQLTSHGIAQANIVMEKYNKSQLIKSDKQDNNKKRTTKEESLNLSFKINTAYKVISNHILKDMKISERACVYLATILEYISAEILYISITSAEDNHIKTVSTKHVNLAIRYDSDLSNVLMGYILGTSNLQTFDDENYTTVEPLKIKIFRDPSIKRILYKAGVKYISKDVYIKVRSIIHDFLKKVLHVVLNIQFTNNKKVITYNDGVMALKTMHISFYSVKNYPGIRGKCKKSVDVSEIEQKNKITKRRKPSSNIPKLIKKYMKTECTILPHSNIKQMIKEIGSKHKNKLIFSEPFLWLIHGLLEKYLVSILRVSYLVTLHSKRTKLEAKDIGIIVAITNNSFNFKA